MDELASLRTERLLLRCIERSDAEDTSRLMTPAISRWLAFWPTPFSPAMALAVIDDMRAQARVGRVAPYAVILQRTNELLGWIVLSRDTQAERRAALGYWLGESYQGYGYGREAVVAVLADAFAGFAVDVIEAAAQKENQRSKGLLTACGMRFTGERLIYALARARHEVCCVYEADAVARKIDHGGARS